MSPMTRSDFNLTDKSHYRMTADRKFVPQNQKRKYRHKPIISNLKTPALPVSAPPFTPGLFRRPQTPEIVHDLSMIFFEAQQILQPLVRLLAGEFRNHSWLFIRSTIHDLKMA